MDNRKSLLLFLALTVGFCVFAQEENPEEHAQEEYPEQDAAEVREATDIPQDARSPLLFVQHLEWSPAEYSASYVVIVEQKREEQYVEVLRRTVQTTSIEVSIPAGDYRYRVLGFNVLGRLDSTSDWEYISIIQATQPSIFSYTPTNFYFDRKSLRIINLEGVNLIVGSEFYLLRRGGKTVMPDEVDEASMHFEENILLPKEVRLTDLGNSAQLVFDEESLTEGIYDIIVRNPGGFEDQAGPFGISVAKPWDLNVSIGYYPLVKLKSDEYILNRPGAPLGFGVNASFVPFKRDFGFMGVELNAFWSYFESSIEDFISRSNLLVLHANYLYQYWIKKDTVAINGRLGAGISGLLGYQFEDLATGRMRSSPGNFAFFSWGGGVSAQWLFYRQLYLESGVDYFHIHDSELPQGFMRFWIGTGWQF